MEKIHLDIDRGHPSTKYVTKKGFYARSIEVPVAVRRALDKMRADNETLSRWLETAYTHAGTRGRKPVPEFPKELLEYGKTEKQKTKPSKKAGDAERVRAGSSGDAG